MDELISIVMPVYKVEPYLDKSLRSVVNQTYKNLEIILVDDGSPDRCGAICNEWALKDRRIRVIHKENGGVAAAWNDGVAAASGDCIGFVDPDDWVEDTMFECLLQALNRFSADIAICGYFDDIKSESKMKQIKYTRYYTREEALKELVLDNDIQSFVWNKLYRRRCIPEKPFPNIKRVSDLGGVYKFFQKADSIIQINQSFYHYVRREDSLGGFWTSPEPFIDYSLAAQDRYRDLWDDYGNIRKELIEKYISSLENIKKQFASSNADRVQGLTPIIKDSIGTFYFARLAEFRLSDKFTVRRELETTEFLRDPSGFCVDKQLLKTGYNNTVNHDKKETDDKNIREIKKLKKELSDLKRSRSFRVGRALTFIPRKIRDFIK